MTVHVASYQLYTLLKAQVIYVYSYNLKVKVDQYDTFDTKYRVKNFPDTDSDINTNPYRHIIAMYWNKNRWLSLHILTSSHTVAVKFSQTNILRNQLAIAKPQKVNIQDQNNLKIVKLKGEQGSITTIKSKETRWKTCTQLPALANLSS